MRRVLTATVVAMLAGSIGLRGDDIATRWWSHVEALASDSMEGRNTGSPTHKRAADYVRRSSRDRGSSLPVSAATSSRSPSRRAGSSRRSRAWRW